MNRFYVYAAMHQGKVVYIGKGTGERWKHCISGVSTCYYLNFLHFQGEEVTAKIICNNLTDETACKVENELIYRYCPKGNTRRDPFSTFDKTAADELALQGITVKDLLKLERSFSFADAVPEQAEGWTVSDNSMFPSKESIFPIRYMHMPRFNTVRKTHCVQNLLAKEKARQATSEET